MNAVDVKIKFKEKKTKKKDSALLVLNHVFFATAATFNTYSNR